MTRFLLNLFRKIKNEKVFDKGRDCHDNGLLLDYQIEKSENKNETIFEMEGRINGTGEVYTPEIKFTKNELIDFHCNCVYFDLNKCICEHIIALAFEGNNFIEELEETEEREIIEYFKKKEVEKNRIFLEIELLIVNKSEINKPSLNIDITLSAYGKRYKLNNKVSEFLANYEENPMKFGTKYTYNPKRDYFSGWEKEFIEYLKELHEFYTFNTSNSAFSIEKILERKKSTERLFNILEKNKKLNIKEESLEKFIKINLEHYNEKINMSISDSGKYVSVGHSYIVCRDVIDTKIYKISSKKLEEFREFEKIMELKNWNIGLKEEYIEDIINKISRFCQINLDKKLKEKIYEPKLIETGILIDLYRREGIILNIKKLFDGKEKKDIEKIVIGNEDVDKEDIFQILGKYNFVENDERYILNDPEEVYSFVKEDIPNLSEKYKILYSKDFKIKKYETVNYQVSTKITDLFEISFEVYGITNEEVYEVLKAIKEKKKYYILKNGEMLLLEENKNMEELSKLLAESDAKKNEILSGTIKREKSYGYFLSSFLEKLSNIKLTNDFENIYQKIIQCKEKSNVTINKNFPMLREYQKIGVQWLLFLRKLGMGGILADDMGLGKTIQIISYLSAIKEKKGLKLIIVPKTLMYNWRNEFKKFAPELNVNIVEGKAAVRKEIIENSETGDILISTYGFLVKDEELYKDISIDTLVIDEAQNIKNFLSRTAGSVKKIKADIRIALTGTPIENNTLELWSIFDFVFPGYLGKHTKFLKKYSENLKELKEMIAPFILRRLKNEVLDELPEKIETDIIVELSDEEKKLYLAYLEKSKKEIHEKNNSLEILVYLTRLRQLCNHPKLFLENYNGESSKLETLLELLEECKSGGHRVLLFSQFTEMLDIIKKNIPKKMTYLYLDGKTKSEHRVELVERFNSGEGDIFIISLKAGGSGLNLTGADTVIHFDPWWNSSVENQATDRAYRMGQTKNVNVFKLIAKGTIEEKINIIKDEKEKLIREILDEKEEGLNSITQKDIFELLNAK
ncbi:DEAD/DEAH box helicase [Fusobacterium sp.]|uniref:DEAD/DEAH box helicase n=1 Tax=Fusobacterium sp. TaxID=68766 RepID=UPI0028FE6A6E|nr:DEAD/DEAH box helicase [Fusobacterium sp.]MDU1910883.1 DEAD/DEAH box helicase [Fusobacterium sp.]